MAKSISQLPAGTPASTAKLEASLAGVSVRVDLGDIGPHHTHTLAQVTDKGALAAKSTVATADLDADAVTAAKIASGQVLPRHIVGGSASAPAGVAGVATLVLDDAVDFYPVTDATVSVIKVPTPAAARNIEIGNLTGNTVDVVDSSTPTPQVIRAGVPNRHAVKIARVGGVWAFKVENSTRAHKHATADVTGLEALVSLAVSGGRGKAVGRSAANPGSSGAPQAIEPIQAWDSASAVQRHYGHRAAAATVVAGTLTCDLTGANGANCFRVTLDQDVTALVIANPQSATGYNELLLELVQGAGGPWGFSWPPAVIWPGGVPPTLSTDEGARDLVRLVSLDGSTAWNGILEGRNVDPLLTFLFEGAVAASEDDAAEIIPDGTCQTSLTVIGLQSDRQALVRIAAVDVPQGAVILDARAQVSATLTQSSPLVVTVWGEDADDAAAATTSTNDITGRARTSASVVWNIPAWTADERAAPEVSPNLRSVIQEIVGRPGWSAGNALALILEFTSGGAAARQFATFDHATLDGPALSIRWAEAPAAPDLGDLGDVDVSGPSDGDVLTYVLSGDQWVPAAPPTGLSAFVELGDAPASYSGQGGKLVAVNAGATGLEFVAAPEGAGDMLAAVYDPTAIAASPFARANHTGTQTLATISDAGALAELDDVDGLPIDMAGEDLTAPRIVTCRQAVASPTIEVIEAGFNRLTLDLAAANVFAVTLDKDVHDLALANVPADAVTIALILTQDGTGGRTVAWPALVEWVRNGGVAPTLNAGAGVRSSYGLLTLDGGVSALGF